MANFHNIVLLGFMGAGKTAVARLLAERLNLTKVDTDDVIVEMTGKTIAEIFAKEGEEKFRCYESEAVAAVAARKGQVIATGGGIVLREKNVEVLSTFGLLVFLRATCETLLGRVKNSETFRPLAQNEDNFRKLFQTRLKLYERVPNIIDTDDISIAEVTSVIESLFRQSGAIAPHGGSW